MPGPLLQPLPESRKKKLKRNKVEEVRELMDYADWKLGRIAKTDS